MSLFFEISKRNPKVIVTNQDNALMNVIDKVFMSTILYNVSFKFPKMLEQVYNGYMESYIGVLLRGNINWVSSLVQYCIGKISQNFRICERYNIVTDEGERNKDLEWSCHL